MAGLQRNQVFTGFFYDLQVVTHDTHGAKGGVCPFTAVTVSVHS